MHRLDFFLPICECKHSGEICLKKLNQVPQNWIPADQHLWPGTLSQYLVI